MKMFLATTLGAGFSTPLALMISQKVAGWLSKRADIQGAGCVLRVRPYIRYAERAKPPRNAVDRAFCDAIRIEVSLKLDGHCPDFLLKGLNPLLGCLHLIALRVFLQQLIVDNFSGLVVFEFFKGQALFE